MNCMVHGVTKSQTRLSGLSLALLVTPVESSSRNVDFEGMLIQIGLRVPDAQESVGSAHL